MPAAQRTIMINRPPDQVLAFFTDPANDLRWRSHVKQASADGPIRVGSSIHQSHPRARPALAGGQSAATKMQKGCPAGSA